ncbi:MAG: MBL fold metallo-hydrolase [Chloroflexota bacterium]
MSNTLSLKQLEDDIYQLRLPLPFALDHVNVYLLAGANGWTILDCGINWEASRRAWQQAFEELNITEADIEKIVLTHVHPDHFGLAGWLTLMAHQAGNDVPLYLSAREHQQMLDVWVNPDVTLRFWLRDNGMPNEMATDVENSMGNTHSMTLPHPRDLEIIDYDSLITLGNRQFKALHAPGHSDGQLIFYDEDDKLLLSGDHVLMKITPNIGLWDGSDANPLGLYLNSLRQLSQLDVRRAFPGHRQIIEDWEGRIGELLLHHQHRLDVTLDALEKGAETPYQVANRIFETRRFSAHEWRFAIAETLSHLEYLRLNHTIQQDMDAQRFWLT